MDQPPVVAVTALADAWPRAMEMEIGTALCAIGVGRTWTFFHCYHCLYTAECR